MKSSRKRCRYHKRNKCRKFLIALAVLLVVIGTISIWQLIDFLGKPEVVEKTVIQFDELINRTTSEPEYIEFKSTESTGSESAEFESTESESAESESSENALSNISEDNSLDEPTTVLEPTGTIYLTFDDGPSTEITPQILDILKEKNVKATFFILDYETGSEKENLIIRELNEGHTVGLHGASHEYSIVYSSLDATISSFVSLQEKLLSSTGYYSTIIRFPGGSSNTVSKKYCEGIMSASTQALTELGFTYFDWNVDSDDAGSARSSEKVLENVTSALMEGKNNVILMHDSANKTYTLGALESIIDYGLENGYEFKAIDSSTPQVKHSISN